MNAINQQNVLLLLLSTFAATIITTRGIIIEGPSNVTYLPGVTPLPIELTCNITGEISLWSINDTVFTPTNLPAGHRTNGFNLLIDTPINNTEYVCVSVMDGNQIRSAPAYLIFAAINLSATRTVLSADIMSIMLSWNQLIGDFEPIASYSVMGCTDAVNGIFPQCPTFSSISTLSASVTQTSFDVSTMAEYIFSITALNMNGQNVLSSNNVTVLRPSAPRQSPQMVSGIPVIPASINLTWNMPDVTDAEAPLTGYEIMFVDDRFLSLARIVPDTINVEVGLQTSHLQTGLSPNTDYSVGIAAVNLIGTGPFSSSINFRITSGEGTSGPPLSLIISNVGIEPDTFTVTWSPPSQPNGVITGYEVQYRISSDLMFMSTSTTNTSINLTSLITEVEYIIQVRAINAAGPGNFTSPQTVLNVLLVRFSELTPTTRNAFDGENSEFTCNLFGSSNNVSITSEWLITLSNGTTIAVSGNSSDNFILLPPHNSRLIIVRHDGTIFNGANVTCAGGLNFAGINAGLLISPLTCRTENGRCEEECFTPVDSSDATCRCPINETLVDDKICLSQLLYFTLYNEVYENATTFIHHPLYHPGTFELSCNNDAGINNNTVQWIFSPLDDDSEIIIDQSTSVTLNITVDSMVVPVMFQAAMQSSSVVTLQVSQAIPGNFVCQSNDFTLHLRVITGGEPLLELLPPLPVRAYGMSSFNVTVNGFNVNRFGRTVQHISSPSGFMIMYRSLSVSQPVMFNFVNNDVITVDAPSEFFSTYNPNQNTSYFEITFLAPSGSNASVSFSVVYFDIHGVILLSNRRFFAVGESLVLQCNTTPPDLPVVWERFRASNSADGFVSLANDSRVTFNPADRKTVATLANITLSDAGDYECVGASPQLANISLPENNIFVLPESLTIVELLSNDSVAFLNDRGAYAVARNTPASFACVGVLNDANIELFHSAVNLSAAAILPDNGFEEDGFFPNPNNFEFSSELPYGPLVVHFLTKVVDGNLTCRSRTSGREQSVYIGEESIPGVLAVPLFSTPFVQVLVGDSAQFSYLIALVNSSLNVASSISVVYTGPPNSLLDNLQLLDQGNDAYAFSIPSVDFAMDGATFILQFEGINILASQFQLRVLEQPIYIFSGFTTNIIPNGNIVNDIDSLRFSIPNEQEEDVSFSNEQEEDIAIGKRLTQVIIEPIGPFEPFISLGSLVLICEVLPGYENPYWEISNNNRIVNPVDNQTITNATGDEIASVIILSSPSAVTLIINVPPSEEFPDELNGTYACRVPNSNISSSVILTNTNPYLVAITQPTVEVNFFDPLTLSFRAAFNSDGTANLLPVIFLVQTNSDGSSANDPINVRPDGSSNNAQIFSITFPTVGGNMAGTYAASALSPGSTPQVTVDVTVIPPNISTSAQPVEILSSQSTVLECIPSNPELSIRWVLYQTDGSRIPITFDDSGLFDRVPEVKRNVQLLPSIETRFPHHNITITSADVSLHSGLYVCSIDTPHRDPTVISRNITVDVLPACHGPTLSRGLLWPTTAVNDTAMLPCSEINPSTFRVGPNATRRCLESSDINEGEWDEVDITNCTTRSTQSLLVYSTYLLVDINEDITQNITQIENEFQEQFNNNSANDVMVRLSLHSGQPFAQNSQIIPAVFTIEFLSNSNSLTAATVSRSIISNYNSYSFEEFSDTVEPPELAEITPNDICTCESLSSNSSILPESGEESEINSVRVESCIGIAGPCVCDSSSCACNTPFYAGNGVLCAQDSDQDNRPDIQLECADLTCQMDVCPLIYNPEQNAFACDPESIPGGCPLETDAEFQIMWPTSLPNTNVNNTCRSGTGRAFRFCDSEGNWQSPVVTDCLSFEFAAVMQQAMEITAESANSVITNLASITAPDTAGNTSILPLDIQAATFVLDASIDIAEMNPDLLQEDEFVNNLADVYSNLLNENNEPGYAQADRMQSQMILETSERLAILLAKNLAMNETREPIIRDNIVISVEQRNASDNNDVIFPSQDLLNRAESNFASKTNATIRLPASLIQSRATNGIAPVANIIYRNLDRFLPTNLSNSGTEPQPASVVLSSQVTNVASNIPDGDFATLVFQYTIDNLTNPSNPRCAFWNFSLAQDGGNGGWDVTNVITEDINGLTITCNTTHLTSFAVLVDVSGQSTRSEAESTALSIVSYIGCGISMFCLLIAIIVLAIYRNTILKGIHNFIHLNLAIALFLALLVFVSGIEPATENRNACKVIAALLHYFFTAVFTWMMCEGIMLYFLLVKVFNTGLGQRKLFYLSLGWGIPVPIVAIAAGIAHTHYGTDDYCWISTSEGAIWAFVAPMLAIIIVNIFFMFMALRALFQSKRGNMTAEQSSNADVVRALLKATVILLPLLGITWVFGLLAVNENLTVFAWIFTILNSLQGMFILFFHVIKNDKILTKIKSFFVRSKAKFSLASTGHESSTGYTGTRKKTSAIPSSLQNDSIHLHSVTDKPSYVQANNNSIMENGNNTFKPNTIPEEEEADTNKNASIFIETEDILNSVATVEATDYASEPMDFGPPIASIPDVVTIEVATGGSSNNDFKITCSHEDLTVPTLYNDTAENYSSQENIESQNSEENQYIED